MSEAPLYVLTPLPVAGWGGAWPEGDGRRVGKARPWSEGAVGGAEGIKGLRREGVKVIWRNVFLDKF